MYRNTTKVGQELFKYSHTPTFPQHAQVLSTQTTPQAIPQHLQVLSTRSQNVFPPTPPPPTQDWPSKCSLRKSLPQDPPPQDPPRLRTPINIMEESVCHFTKPDATGKLMQKAGLLIINEMSTGHKWMYECLATWIQTSACQSHP